MSAKSQGTLATRTATENDTGTGLTLIEGQLDAVTRTLAQTFLADGLYPLAGKSGGMILAASNFNEPTFASAQPFIGIQVQAVGFEKGAKEEKPDVVIYAIQASAKALKAIPDHIGEVNIRVERIGQINIKPELASGVSGRGHLYQYHDRIACGSSCAPSDEQIAGTFGAIVTKGEKLFALSNNHVLAACNHTPLGMPILAPSTLDSAPGVPAPRELARHSEIIELKSGHPEMVKPCDLDIAIAEIIDPDVVCSWQGNADFGYDTPTNVAEPFAGMRVMKVGRTTAKTFGVIESFIPTATPIPCSTKFFKGTVWFTDMWYVRAEEEHFAVSGDSGSLIVTDDGKSAVGLLFAANRAGNYGLMMPISTVLAQFGGMMLVDQHGIL